MRHPRSAGRRQTRPGPCSPALPCAGPNLTSAASLPWTQIWLRPQTLMGQSLALQEPPGWAPWVGAEGGPQSRFLPEDGSLQEGVSAAQTSHAVTAACWGTARHGALCSPAVVDNERSVDLWVRVQGRALATQPSHSLVLWDWQFAGASPASDRGGYTGTQIHGAQPPQVTPDIKTLLKGMSWLSAAHQHSSRMPGVRSHMGAWSSHTLAWLGCPRGQGLVA